MIGPTTELIFLILGISILGWIGLLILLKRVFKELQIYLNQLKNIQQDLATIKEKLKNLTDP